MHLRSRCLPRPSASNPLDNRTRPMTNTSQVPDLKGLHRDDDLLPHDLGEKVQNPDRPIKPLKRRAEKSKEEDLLVEIIKRLSTRADPPFTERVLRARVSSKFKLPTQLGIYESKMDPVDHLDSYKSLMLFQDYSDEVMCKAFSATLKGPARSWFKKLPPGTIDSFDDLSRLFIAYFMSYRIKQKNASHLFTVH
ncbi:hypothetical protein Acr_08g0011410 [Actinidia rufa]|uniref:Retrotransposon gag domain-containing protein n=1 Tax=Actinidia rufa TaxID=165716 RepID=A0A7J0F221_9ERIC|nr:hypothetical protein Acr_08g0011410 [Actinidia rufa]